MESINGAVVVIIMFAVLIQFCVDRVKEIAGEKIMHYVKAPLWAAVFGILFSFMFDLDFFRIIGHPSVIPMLSKIITGLIISSGSTGVHELFSKLRDSRNYLNVEGDGNVADSSLDSHETLFKEKDSKNED